jgi:hypothetical protein
VADYTALRAFAGSANSVHVTGYSATSAPSGIAGTFVRDATVTGDNGGTEIVGVHGWRRVFEGAVNSLWFSADPTGAADSITALRAARDAANALGRGQHTPAGTYKITDTLTLPASMEFDGDGRHRTVFNMVSASVKPAISVACPDNSAIIGTKLRGFKVICNGGAAICDGLSLTTTATNSAISQSTFEDIYIVNPRRGVSMAGVIYMNAFRGISISHTGASRVTEYGWYLNSPLEVIYNSFKDLEVTGVGDGAYAYWSNAQACQWDNITADGCCYFGGAYTTVRNLSVETILAAVPPSVRCVHLDQIQSAESIAIIGVANAKCNVGVLIFGVMNVHGVRFPDWGVGNQPDRPVLIASPSRGILSSVKADRAVVTKLGAADFDGMTAIGCEDITDFSLSYKTGTWTPGYATWTTAPTTIVATYTKVGRQVTVCLYAQDGVCPAGAEITGLPFTQSATSASAATGNSATDTTKVIRGSITPGQDKIRGIPALTLTGNFWQITATYFV